jgi:hypothetical protein
VYNVLHTPGCVIHCVTQCIMLQCACKCATPHHTNFLNSLRIHLERLKRCQCCHWACSGSFKMHLTIVSPGPASRVRGQGRHLRRGVRAYYVGPLNVENIRNRENVRRAVLGHLGLAPRLKPRVEPYGSKGMANGNNSRARGRIFLL